MSGAGVGPRVGWTMCTAVTMILIGMPAAEAGGVTGRMIDHPIARLPQFHPY